MFQPGKPGDWQCPTPSCPNHRTPGCFGSAAACKKCGAPKPTGRASPPNVMNPHPTLIGVLTNVQTPLRI